MQPPSNHFKVGHLAPVVKHALTSASSVPSEDPVSTELKRFHGLFARSLICEYPEC
ncbi:MAG: hypothetical protein ACAF41_09725 [Leptolyngbya sp. BL-A-14]